MTENLVMDEKTIAEMGFVNETIYTVEYDLHSKLKIPKDATNDVKAEMKAHNTLAVEFRNKLFFILKFKIMATRHLESSWIIEQKYLANAISEIETLKTEMKEKGFKDVDQRIKIIPVLTTTEGFEHYENKKAEFLIEFLMEHVRYCEKGKDDGKMSKSTLWRCKETLKIVSTLKEEVKDNERFNEIEGTLGILDSLIHEVEPLTELKD